MDILRIGTAVIAAAGMVWVGGSALTHTDPPPPVFISAPAVAAPDAYACAIKCPDYMPKDIGAHELNLPHLATGKDIGAPTLPSVVYVPTYIHDTPVDTAGTGGRAASVAPRASKGTSQGSKASSAKGSTAKASKSSSPKGSTTKAPKQLSTTVTVRDTTSTTAKGTVTHSHSTTTRTTG